MKTLKNPKCELSADGKQITIVADVVDQPFNGLLVTRVSHGHLNPDHSQHPRRIQSSSEAVFCESSRGKFAMPNDVFAAIAAACEPGTTFPPHFKKSSKPGSVEVVSELPFTLQWQISDNADPHGTYPPPVAVWTDIAGADKPTLDESAIPVGKFIRCKATNAAGTTITRWAKKE